MTVLLLARHGETADNLNLVFQGQGGRGLNARGRAQASRLAERLRRAPPTAIVASDLERAVETAGFVASATGLTPSFDADLREVDVGAWAGKTPDEIRELFPDQWSAWSAGFDVRRGDGETYAELAVRVERALARVVAAHPGGRVLVVSHGGAIRSWVTSLLVLPVEGARALASLGNCALTLVERDDQGRSKLHTWNDVAHLEGLVVPEGPPAREPTAPNAPSGERRE